jgi:RNA polymerase sigma factor for flagellar operon FliA
MPDEHILAPPAAPAAHYQSIPGEAVLWRAWLAEGDLRARARLIVHYQSYARAIAAQLYGRRTGDEFEFDEYLQFASVGLIEAVDRFDDTRGILFKSFATKRISGAVLTGLSTLSERQQQLSMRRRMADERLASLQSAPLCAEPQQLLRDLAEIGIGLALGFALEGTGMVAGAEASLPDNTYTRIELRQFQQQLLGLTRRLTAREQEVIQLHYLHNLSFEEIATRLQLTKGRVSQLHSQGLKRLRHLLQQAGRCDIAI